MWQRSLNLFLGSALFLLVACGLATTRPKLEMSLAASAFLAAKEAKANILAPNLFRRAEVLLLKAKSSYRRKYFNKAKQYATLSQKFSEKAEFVAVRKSSLENIEANEPSSPASGPSGANPAPAGQPSAENNPPSPPPESSESSETPEPSSE